MPLATAIAATAMMHARYGDVHPQTVLPFVVEHAGGIMINKEGMQFFRMHPDAADSKINARASDLSSWSSKGLSNFFLQSSSFPILHALAVTVASVPLSSNVALIGGNSTTPDLECYELIKAASALHNAWA